MTQRHANRSHWRLPIAIVVVACLGLAGAAAATWAVSRAGGSTTGAPLLTRLVPTTHTVVRTVTKRLPRRVVYRHGKRVVIPGRTITRSILVSVPGPPVTVKGPTRTITGPGGTSTVIQTIPGPTTTLPGTTITGPTSTVTIPVTGPTTTVTVPGPTTTVTVTVPPTT